MNMVCRLGGFHTMMSFLGSIGSMMKGSGLEEALENIYGPNAVTHMTSGKAVSRALRRHFLFEAALMNKLLLQVLPYINNDNDTVNLNGEAQEPMEESAFEQGCPSDTSYEMDTVIETSCEEEMSPDEAGNDLDLQDKLDPTEVEKIHSLYKGVEDKTILY